ncbi:hypothetical protein Tco_0322536 [Tanacetum coccineum]
MEITKPNIRCWLLVVLLCANIPSRLSLENATIEHSKSLGLVQESRVLTWNENEESMKDDIVSLAKGKSGGRGTGGGNINHAPGRVINKGAEGMMTADTMAVLPLVFTKPVVSFLVAMACLVEAVIVRALARQTIRFAANLPEPHRLTQVGVKLSVLLLLYTKKHYGVSKDQQQNACSSHGNLNCVNFATEAHAAENLARGYDGMRLFHRSWRKYCEVENQIMEADKLQPHCSRPDIRLRFSDDGKFLAMELREVICMESIDLIQRSTEALGDEKYHEGLLIHLYHIWGIETVAF